VTAFLELSDSALLGLAFVFGACIGSFLNVVIFSYALLLGRCRGCGARISPRYPLVEAATGLLFAALLAHGGLDWNLPVRWLLAAALLAIAFIDYEHHIIPNAITYPGIPLGLVVSFLLPVPDWREALAGVLIAGGMMWAISAFYQWRTGRVGLGMGDVKLVAMLGGFLGIQAALGIMVLGSLLGLVHGLVMIGVTGGGRHTQIPFGPALALAGIVHLFDPLLLPRLLSS
jgi:leader peptidase (prepilin peptidase)/N-methyltransferase